MEHWYALHTKPHQEYQVAATLQQRGLETYLPEIREAAAAPEGKRKPFFPAYLFLKVDFEAVRLSYVQWTPGLRYIVTCGDQFLPVSNKVVELIQHKLGELETRGDWLPHTFKPGDTVRITAGPFQDMFAVFEGPTTPSQRVQVLLQVLGASRVQVDVADLELERPRVVPPVGGGRGKAPLNPETAGQLNKGWSQIITPKRPRRTRGRGRPINYQAL